MAQALNKIEDCLINASLSMFEQSYNQYSF